MRYRLQIEFDGMDDIDARDFAETASEFMGCDMDASSVVRLHRLTEGKQPEPIDIVTTPS